MSRRCELCEKGAKKAANRSHAKNKTLRRQKVNLQTVDGVKLCTKCIRTITKKAVEMTA